MDIYGPQIDPTEIRSQIGMVFQQPNPFPTMTIYDNVVAGVKLKGQKLPKAEMDEIVRAIAARRRTSGTRSTTG